MKEYAKKQYLFIRINEINQPHIIPANYTRIKLNNLCEHQTIIYGKQN